MNRSPGGAKSLLLLGLLTIPLALAAAVWAFQGDTDMSYPIERFADERAKAFIRAVIDGDRHRAITLAAAAPGGVNTMGANGESALLLATEQGDTDMVRGLIGAGADPNGGSDRSPLHPATRQSSGKILKLLLAANADPNRMHNGETPLFEAALIGHIAAAEMLLSAGAQPDLGQRDGGDSPALAASSADKWEMVELLIARGASPWYTSANGSTIASDAYSSRKISRAREEIIKQYKQFGYPWPPPKPPLVRQMQAEKRWPPQPARH